jgi:ATP-dependent protease Clp ATPase subunit
MGVISIFTAFFYNTFTFSLITKEDVLSAVREEWLPITGHGSLEQQLTSFLSLTEDIGRVELEVHLRKLEADRLVEIQYQPRLHIADTQVTLVRCCRMTELGRRRQAGFSIIN